MALPLLASAVLIALLVAWTLEFRHREEVLPALSNRRMVAPFVVTPFVAGLGGRPLAAAALFAVLLARAPVQRVIEGATGASLVRVLEETGRVQLVFGVLFAAGLFFGS